MDKFVVIIPSPALVKDLDKTCKYCGGSIHLRNPTGGCDHLYYPENCEGYKKEQRLLKKE